MFSVNIATQDGILISPNVIIGFRSQAGSYEFQHIPFDSSFPCHNCKKMLLTGMTISPVSKKYRWEKKTIACKFHAALNSSVSDGAQSVVSDGFEEDEACPVDCVREFKTDEEFLHILEKAKQTNSLVVVDFYRTSCGSCKYIEQGFRKLCKGSGDHKDSVIFLKHNVIDEYDEQSEVAERLRIKTVPLFHFYKDGVLLEAFATRDKERILAAISKYMAPVS